MHIIFEGCDRTGKTNIAKSLSKDLDIPYFKNEFETEIFKSNKLSFKDATFYDQTMFIQYLEQTKNSSIRDRSYFSEIVYSNIFKRNTLSDEFFTNLDIRYSEVETYVIYCYKTLNIEHDDLIDFSLYNKIQKKYLESLSKSKCKILHLDTTDQNLDSQISKIKKFIYSNVYYNKLKKCNKCKKMIEARIGECTEPIKPLGIFESEFMFIGMAPGRMYVNTKNTNDSDEAAKYESGDVLRSALLKLKILDKSFITNIFKCPTPLDSKFLKEDFEKCFFHFLYKEIKLIKPKKIFIMGSDAKAYLQKIELINKYKDVFFINHPARIKEFQDFDSFVLEISNNL